MGIGECDICGKTCWFEEHKLDGKRYCKDCWKKLMSKQKKPIKKSRTRYIEWIIAIILILTFLYFVYTIAIKDNPHFEYAERARELAEEECQIIGHGKYTYEECCKLAGCIYMLGNCYC